MAIAVASPLKAADLAGLYVTDQMEMAGALELRGDGRFRYQFDYGAVSESAEGGWAAKGQKVELTSEPMPKAPDFALVRDEPAPNGKLFVAVEDAGFSWSPMRVQVALEGVKEPVELHAGGDGQVIVPQGRRATSVSMMVPVYGVAGTPVVLGAGRGHRLLFRLEANDIGKAAFRAEPVVIDGTSLVMKRYDTTIVFRRAGQ
ncbi:MAG TPA: hypothetical protein VFU80_03225 [Sphingomicrobium sp.]|nr:hypothetical protein [Sphingomicrobium sp.]